ncbi:MAG: hypothetical protein M0Q91_05390 [Methanoregula sp.]|jgi:hypothetical protein|nr:hypothetical protein [Methanoregula sp.]
MTGAAKTIPLREALEIARYNNNEKTKAAWFAEKRPRITRRLNSTSKAFYDNSCWVAMGKCDRCRAPDCADRDWRKRGEDAPS